MSPDRHRRIRRISVRAGTEVLVPGPGRARSGSASFEAISRITAVRLVFRTASQRGVRSDASRYDEPPVAAGARFVHHHPGSQLVVTAAPRSQPIRSRVRDAVAMAWRAAEAAGALPVIADDVARPP